MARKHNIIIVGAGLFGSIAAKLAREHGHDVTVVDSREPWAASKASGCVIAPSWLNSLSREQIDAGMGVLNDLYTVHDVEFQTNALAKFKAKRVAPSDILKDADVHDTVVEVRDGLVKLASGDVLRGKVLVAAGIGTAGHLIKAMPAMRGLWGASMRFKGVIDQPRIHVYAPYKQAVAFQLSRSEVWMGDGTALVDKTWRESREGRIDNTARRGASLFGLSLERVKFNEGARPYVEGHKAGFFVRVTPNVWVSTGGAKNGTLLAAANAAQFLKELP
jgi:glycine/D-amino acid oxidase-like deaminating enzyme